jgi:Mg-chelatase subunit ChlD
MQDAENITADPDAFLKKNYLVIFDGSGSMKETGCSDGKPKIKVAKTAVTRWADSVGPDANLGLVAFYGATFSTLPLGSSRQQFNDQVRAVAANGKTPLGRSIEAAYAMLTKQAFRQNGYGEYNIVVVTDGAASDEERMNRWVAAILRDSPIQITTIGFCIGDDHSLNEPGRTIYKAANNPQELARGLEEVLAEAEQFDLSEFE